MYDSIYIHQHPIYSRITIGKSVQRRSTHSISFERNGRADRREHICAGRKKMKLYRTLANSINQYTKHIVSGNGTASHIETNKPSWLFLLLLFSTLHFDGLFIHEERCLLPPRTRSSFPFESLSTEEVPFCWRAGDLFVENKNCGGNDETTHHGRLQRKCIVMREVHASRLVFIALCYLGETKRT